MHGYVFAMSIGYFLLMPVLSYQLLLKSELDALFVALLGNLRATVQNLMMLPAVFVLNRTESRKILVLASIIRGIGFFLFSSNSPAVLLLAAVLTGMGGGLFFPASMRLYLTLTTPESRALVFARREMLNSLGAVIGPLLCTLLLSEGLRALCVASGALYACCALMSFFALPVCWSNDKRPRKIMDFKLFTAWYPYAGFMACCSLASVIQNQQTVVLAICANRIGYGGVKWIILVDYAALACIQVPLSKWVADRLSIPLILALAVLLYIVGLAIQWFIPGQAWLYLGSLIFMCGIALFVPAKNQAFASSQHHIDAAMSVGIHGMMTSVGDASVGTAFALAYDKGQGLLLLILLMSGIVLSAILAGMAPPNRRRL